jgi:putative addiction module component (TIGR02574 family)
VSVDALRSYLRIQIDRADESILNRIASIFDEFETEKDYSNNEAESHDFLTDDQKQELLSRYEEFKQGKVKGYSFEEMKDLIMSRHKPES